MSAMRVLTVPNWSFGRNTPLLRAFTDVLDGGGVRLHYLNGDVDHNRTVSAFSGEPEAVTRSLMRLADLAFDAIDLNRHSGVHPRIGALDVCPFIVLDGTLADALKVAETFAAELSQRHALPVYLYEKSERGRHEADLPSLRKGGFGGLIGRVLNPDFGPTAAHPRLGITVLGVRDSLVAMNVNLKEPSARIAKLLAKQIRDLRAAGDPRFLGVRALGFPLASRGISQVSLNVTLPDITPIDPIIAWVNTESEAHGVAVAGTELVGVIRPVDMHSATRLPIRSQQIVD